MQTRREHSESSASSREWRKVPSSAKCVVSVNCDVVAWCSTGLLVGRVAFEG